MNSNKMDYRLLGVIIFHAIFSCFSEIQSEFINYLIVPVNRLFNESLSLHYDIDSNNSEWVNLKALQTLLRINKPVRKVRLERKVRMVRSVKPIRQKKKVRPLGKLSR